MKELNISIDDCEGLFAEQVLPYNKDLSAIVIPKIGEKFEEDDVLSLDSYVVIANNKTFEIENLFFESYETSGWNSDAIFIYDISIDTTAYAVTKNKNAFGVILSSRSMSQPNPYYAKGISLFIPKGDKLVNILKNYPIYDFGGETNMRCIAEFIVEEKELKVSKNKTSTFFDIDVTVINSTIFREDPENGEDCIEKKTSKTSKKILKYKNGTYHESLKD